MKASRTNHAETFVRTSAALLFLLLLASHGARAQEPPKPRAADETRTVAAPTPKPTPAARTVLAGRVLGESGEPISDVPVSLAPRTSGIRRVGSDYAVVADEGGDFRFEGLDPGLYEVYTTLPGFVPETDPLTGRPPGPYRPGDNILIRLARGGIVTGMVTDQQGQPLVALNVRAVRVRDLDGGTPNSPFPATGEDRTDDRGVYRIYGLRPGLYVVYAGGYNNTPVPFSGGSGEAATFYPSGTRDTAAEISVRGGQEVGGLDIRLRDDPARRVTGTVESATGSFGELGVGINLMYASTGMPAGTAFLNPNNPSGDRSFYFDGIGDGEYDLQATVNGRDGMTLASTPQRVSVHGADVTGLRLTLVPLASASGTVRFEPAAEAGRPAPESCKAVRATQLPQETLLTASAAMPVRPKPGSLFSRLAVPQSAAPDGAGAFTVRSLDAGRYRLTVRLFDEALYVRSIQAPAPATPQRTAGAQRTAAAATVSRDVFDVKAGQQFSGLSVRVAEGAASFAGSIAAAEPAGSAPPTPIPSFSQLRVHLVPQERERAEETLHYYEAPVSGDGTFAFRNLAPGRYLVLARPFVAEGGESGPRPAALDTNTRALLRREAESASTTVELKPCQRTNDFVVRFPPK